MCVHVSPTHLLLTCMLISLGLLLRKPLFFESCLPEAVSIIYYRLFTLGFAARLCVKDKYRLIGILYIRLRGTITWTLYGKYRRSNVPFI